MKRVMKTSTILNGNMAIAVAGGLLMAAWPLAAQQPPMSDKSTSPSKVVRLNRAPVSKEVLHVTLPKPYETTLPNGLRVLVLEDHRFPLVTLNLIILGAGATAEPAESVGLASATAAMLGEGTPGRTSRQIAEETEKLGADINFFAPFGGTTANMVAFGLSDNFKDWFALALDQLLHPTFPADELAKWKQRAAVRLRQQRSSPQFLLRERYSLAVYCANPDDASTCLPESRVSDTAASVDAMSVEKIAAWHHTRYAPQNALLAVAGDVDTKALVAKLTADLATWKRTDQQDTPPAATKAVPERRIYLVDRPNSVQTTMWLGNIAIDRRDPDYVPVVVANRVFGGGPAARLFLNLREEKGYTYGVYSNFTAVRYAGPWAAAGDVTRDVTDGAMHEFLYEITRLGKDPVPDAELDDARRSVVASFAISLEQPDRLLGYAVDQAIYSLPADYWDMYPAKIAAVSAADVTRVGAKYLDPAKIQIVAVGDAKKVLPAFQQYGTVKLYDTQGKPEALPPAPAGSAESRPAPAAPKLVAANVATASAANPTAPAQQDVPKRIRASANVTQARIITMVKPVYPPEARAAAVTGTVRLHAVISGEGNVEKLDVVSGDPLLAAAALDAVRQWKYKPTLIDNYPVKVETLIDVNFTLNNP
jgi:zinc protease